MKLLITALMFTSLLWTGCSKQPPKEAAGSAAPAPAEQTPRPGNAMLRIEPSMLRDLRITTSAVERRSAGESTAMLGELRPNENAYAEVGAPISSRVVKVSAAPGQAVSSGQVLATLQSSEVGKARSDAISAQSRLELANKTLERKQRLAAERIVAQRDVQEAEANVESATAELRASKATLRALGVSPSDAERLGDDPTFSLRTPVSGTVIERDAVQGRLADPGKPLFRVGDLGRLWLTVHAFERDAVRVESGSKARVVFTALPGRSFTGTVTLIGKEVEPDSRTVPVRIDIDNRDGLLRPGMSATAWLTVGREQGELLTVPSAALQRLQERWVVFLPRSETEFEMRQVGRGRDLGSEVEIVSGLKPDDNVVVDGAFLLKAQAERAAGEGEEHEH